MRSNRSDGTIGFYDNNDIVFETSDWFVVTVAKLVWRYGLDFIKIRNIINDIILNKFDRWVVKFQTIISCVQLFDDS